MSHFVYLTDNCLHSIELNSKNLTLHCRVGLKRHTYKVNTYPARFAAKIRRSNIHNFTERGGA